MCHQLSQEAAKFAFCNQSYHFGFKYFGMTPTRRKYLLELNFAILRMTHSQKFNSVFFLIFSMVMVKYWSISNIKIRKKFKPCIRWFWPRSPNYILCIIFSSCKGFAQMKIEIILCNNNLFRFRKFDKWYEIIMITNLFLGN